MKAQIDALIDSLTELRDANHDLDAVKAEHAEKSADLATLNETLAATKADLESAQTGLNAVQVKNLKKYNEDIFNKGKELEALNTAVRDAKNRLDSLNVEVKSAADKHDQIEASIASLRQRLG